MCCLGATRICSLLRRRQLGKCEELFLKLQWIAASRTLLLRLVSWVEKLIEPQQKDLRNYPRVLAPKEAVVVWRSGDQRGASRLGRLEWGDCF
jgi:hypothetical protein